MVSKKNVVLIVLLFVLSMFYLTYDIYVVTSHKTCQVIEYKNSTSNAKIEDKVEIKEELPKKDTHDKTQTPPVVECPKIENNKTNATTLPDGFVYFGQENMASFAELFNKYSTIRNPQFELEEDFVPIAIRAHDRINYMKFVIDQYREVIDINQTMLVFSLDGFVPEMIELIESIDFCQVKIVIFPWSGHLHGGRFPGNDGSRRGWLHAEIKHHFWWHVHYLFQDLFLDHNGYISLMEEDHAPTQDFYITIKSLIKIKEIECPNCFNIQFNHPEKILPRGITFGVKKTGHFSNIGLTFDRNSFDMLHNAIEFCSFDDYNWDWTIIYLRSIGKISPNSFQSDMGRAYHIGTCGFHKGKKGGCPISDKDKTNFLSLNNKIMESVGSWDKYVLQGFSGTQTHLHGWGGWANELDHKLCMKIAGYE